MTSTQRHIRFRPRRRVSADRRRLLFLFGPLLWLLALVVAAFVTRHGDAIRDALIILAASFVVSLVPLVVMRNARVREEREP